MTAAIGPAASRRGATPFERACDGLDAALEGPVRAEIVTALLHDGDLAHGLRRLRGALRSHSFRTASGRIELGALVAELDSATRRDGFHVFLEWHDVAYRFIEEDIAVVLLDYVAGLPELARAPRQALAILLDFYFLYVLALCATRVWDDPDPAAGFARVTALLERLQGPHGSGRRFVDGAETLLWVAISTYEPDDLAYHRLLGRVVALPQEERTRVARVGAPLLGCHLRWGFPHLYETDLYRLRADNFIDYPWLCFSVATLVEEYARAERGERSGIAIALLNGLTPDPDAFLGEPPPSLAGRADEQARARAGLLRHRDALLADFAALDPGALAYSPLGFHFNFPHNALFAMAVLALVQPDLPNASLNALLGGAHDGSVDLAEIRTMADRLTAFAAANPEPRGSRSVLGLYYDRGDAEHAFARAVGALRGA